MTDPLNRTTVTAFDELPPGPATAELSGLVDRLAQEMVAAWDQGDYVQVEDLLARHPALAHHADLAIELAYEELCLRQQHGRKLSDDEFLARFPQWRSQLKMLLDCHHAFTRVTAEPDFPPKGETFGEFRLLAELGRGTQGRVYLAEQPSLSDRPVVLKVTSGRSLEHLSLARAQHTHIVPLYSVHDDPERGLKALCMPYFGGASLWQLLDELADTPVEMRSGRELLAALDRLQATSQVQLIARGPGRRILERATYVQAIVWIGACLAEALHYAHERRLVHLDVKPSNVLIAADGQPMLLDFHLAQEPIVAGEKIVRPLGGTPAYMSPEQRAAVDAARADRPVPFDVGVTADVYSLGLTLYEALGKPAAGPSTDSRPPRVPLQRLNGEVPLSIADLIERSLAPKAADRYQDASQVATDLRRHLSNLPLLGVANRSLAERWTKWRRHRPYALYAWVAASAVVFLTVWSVLQAVRRLDDHVDRAVAALAKGHQQAHHGRYVDALESFATGQALIGDARGHDALSEQFLQASRDALRLQAAEQLRRLVGRLRLLEGAELSADTRRSVEGRCQALWNDRARIVERLRSGEDDLSPKIRAELLDLALLLTDLRAPLALSRDGRPSAGRGTVILDQAEALLGANPILDYEQRRHAVDSGSVAKSSAEVELPQVTSAWEHTALGRSLLRQSRAGEAMPHFVRAVELAPDDLWPRFYKGLCAFRLGQPEHALAEITACIALAPDEATLWFHRALVNTAVDDIERAIDDYSAALKRDPGFRQAEVNRAKLRARADRR